KCAIGSAMRSSLRSIPNVHNTDERRHGFSTRSVAPVEREVAGVGVRQGLAPPRLPQRLHDPSVPKGSRGHVDGRAELVVGGARARAPPGAAVAVAADPGARQGLLGARTIALHHRDGPAGEAFGLPEGPHGRRLEGDPVPGPEGRGRQARVPGGEGVQTADVVRTAGDGNRFAAFSAVSDEAGAPGMVILPDVRGLHPFYRDLALRFGALGVHATALDYFGRTAGIGPRGD